MDFTILNKKQTKRIINILEEQFNIKGLTLNYVFLKNKENKIFITNRDIEKISLEKLRINNIGLYIGQLKDDQIRLSIEGSQLIGKYATNNVIDLDKKQTIEWLKGNYIKTKTGFEGFIIVKNNNDFLGSGLIKDNKILNFVPKERRLTTIYQE